MEDKEIQKKIDELYENLSTRNFKVSIKNLIKEAILFGQSHMKQKAIACVPEEAVDKLSGMAGERRIIENKGFNDCREQTLSAIESIEI